MSRSTKRTCRDCGFFLPLAGSLGAMFGVCGNELSADGHVVDKQYGCGAHSDTPAPAGTGSALYEPYDDGVLDVTEKPTVQPAEVPAEAGAEARQSHRQKSRLRRPRRPWRKPRRRSSPKPRQSHRHRSRQKRRISFAEIYFGSRNVSSPVCAHVRRGAPRRAATQTCSCQARDSDSGHCDRTPALKEGTRNATATVISQPSAPMMIKGHSPSSARGSCGASRFWSGSCGIATNLAGDDAGRGAA